MEHWLLQHDACQNVTMHVEASGGGYISAKYAPKIKELEEAQDHAQRMHLTVDKYFTPPPSRKAAALRKTAQAESRRLKSRLRQYPIASTVDEAWEMVDDLLLPQLSQIVGTGKARDFLQDISFFQPVHTTDTAPADGGFRLPVLLIWHQHPNYDLDPVTKNVQRLCCASAARFLAVLGISDFGLITAGQSAYPCVAWHSSADEVSCIPSEVLISCNMLTDDKLTVSVYRGSQHGRVSVRPFCEGGREAIRRIPGRNAGSRRAVEGPV